MSISSARNLLGDGYIGKRPHVDEVITGLRHPAPQWALVVGSRRDREHLELRTVVAFDEVDDQTRGGVLA